METINQNEFELSACYATVNNSLLFRRIKNQNVSYKLFKLI